MIIHYKGRIRWHGGEIFPGWTACCAGQRAEKIKENGNHSDNKSEVTCKSCLKMIERGREWNKELNRRLLTPVGSGFPEDYQMQKDRT